MSNSQEQYFCKSWHFLPQNGCERCLRNRSLTRTRTRVTTGTGRSSAASPPPSASTSARTISGLPPSPARRGLVQFWQIHKAIWTNTLSNLDKYIKQFGQIHFAFWPEGVIDCNSVLKLTFAGLWPGNTAVLRGGAETTADYSKAKKAVCPGRAEEQQVLGEEVQKQRGCKEVARSSSSEGKSDRDASAIPWGREHSVERGGGAS